METVSRETSLDGWYVTGLIDGVGSFTYSRSGKQLAVYFAVKVSGSIGVLEELQAFFQGGSIYTSDRSSYFRIQRRDELAVVLDHFDRFPLRTKREVYDVWREMVIAKRAFRKPDRDRLESLATELSNLTR
ncbi:MAG: LAGLIDADG family homing endonuclease [Myxococcota bacterium]|nr:hypothetical protein [Deltaproteobacteria bacterium]MDQ3338554.1 LAGLIDADG family homing endonuclease [Myxococcota bacterium]